MLLAALLASVALPASSLDSPELPELRLASAWLAQDRASRDDDGPGPVGPTTLQAAGASSTPQRRTFGVGLQLGYPTALTVKYMLRADQGLVGGIGGFSGFAYEAAAFSLHVDWVYHPHLLTAGEAFAVTWYVGVGGNILVFQFDRQRSFLPNLAYSYYPTRLWLAARVPIGVSLAMTQLPLEIYLEATPQILVFPGLGFGLGASIGARFYL